MPSTANSSSASWSAASCSPSVCESLSRSDARDICSGSAPAGSGGATMDYLRDIRLTIRHLLRQPGYASAVVITLALAIGASSGIFSAVYAVLLKPLPIDDAERLAVSWGADSSRDRAVV